MKGDLFAGIAVVDLRLAVDWYQRFFGFPPSFYLRALAPGAGLGAAAVQGRGQAGGRGRGGTGAALGLSASPVTSRCTASAACSGISPR